MTNALLGSAIALPLLLFLACASSGLRARLPFLLPLAPVPALAAALLATRGSMLTVGTANAALHFSLDLPGTMLLGTAAVLWICAGVYAMHTLREHPDSGGLIVAWLMTLAGCVGVFLAADLIAFYLLLALLSVGATGLVLQGKWPRAVQASAIYLGVALFAEAILLVGLILLAQAVPNGSLLIRDAAAALPNSPWRDATLLLLLTGLGIKAGLVPFHFWMPISYGAAPIPAAAVMSGAAVKASILAMIRLLPLGIPEFGHPLASIGLVGAFYGVAIGITQSRPEIILAYSSVSQMGFLAALIGMGLARADPATTLAASFYAANHLLVKGALFLAVGAALRTARHRLVLLMAPAAIIALGLAGLPFTGGALAKYAAKDVMGAGLTTIGVASSVATTLLMIHFLRRLSLATAADPKARASGAVSGAWLAMAIAALVVPWILYLSTPLHSLSNANAPGALWAALYPVLIGAGLAIVLDPIGARLPRAPAGDVGAALIPLLAKTGVAVGRVFDNVDAFARRWPVAGISLLLVALVFGLALRAAI